MTPEEFCRAEACLTPAHIDGRRAVRVSFGGAATEHVVDLWRLLRALAGE